MKTLAAAILLTISATVTAGPYSDGAIKDYEFASKQLVESVQTWTSIETKRGGKIAAVERAAFNLKDRQTQEYMDYCMAWQTVIVAYKMERDSANYQAWLLAATPIDTKTAFRFAQVYCH
jgi:hypothetical protein